MGLSAACGAKRQALSTATAALVVAAVAAVGIGLSSPGGGASPGAFPTSPAGLTLPTSPAGGASAAAAGGSSGPGSGANGARPAPAGSAGSQAVTITPATGTGDVPLDQPVVVDVAGGSIRSVVVAPPSGPPLPGATSSDGHRWQSSDPLKPATTYVVTATARSETGTTSTSSARFSTLTPKLTVTAAITPTQGETVGVGEPITFRFSRPVTSPAAQSAVLSHLAVAMTQVVTGGWHWFSDTELHFRPETYWPSGDQVAVSADLDGWDAGGGGWGVGTQSERFLVGAANVSTVDQAAHTMTVTSNGVTQFSFPISTGRSQYPTMGGVHIALDKEPVVHMVSSTVGIPVRSRDGYDETVYWDVHISDSGEYVHAAPWSVGEQGSENVSHGCVNLSTVNAHAFYDFSQPGDVINVINGVRPPSPGDHGLMDWTTPWTAWTLATVGGLAAVPPASFVTRPAT